MPSYSDDPFWKRLILHVPVIGKYANRYLTCAIERNRISGERDNLIIGQANHKPCYGDTGSGVKLDSPSNCRRRLKMLPQHEVPILINSYDRLTCLKKLVDWLVRAGHRRIFIIDNKSTYQPLINYLIHIEQIGIARVVRLGRNCGHTAIWEQNILERLAIDSEYIYTDNDTVPSDFCPTDAVGMLQSILNSNDDIAKAGLGLRIDDIPEHYAHKESVLAWEKQFWLSPAARGLFNAQIDTTFALYRPQGEHGLDAETIRTGWPYLASHEGWYINHLSPSDEDTYYFDSSCSGLSHWSVRIISKWLEDAISEQEQKHPRILHIGCGNDIIPGYINVDNSNNPKVDIMFDLNDCAAQAIPISDNSIDGIYGCHVFEHINDTLSMMSELHRIAKPNCQMVLHLPYGSSNDAVEDPTHVRPYYEGSFVYFSQPAYSRADYGYNGDWDIYRIRLILPKAMQEVPEQELRRIIRNDRNVVIEMIVNLRALKPIRARSHLLLKWPLPELVFSPIDKDTKFILV